MNNLQLYVEYIAGALIAVIAFYVLVLLPDSNAAMAACLVNNSADVCNYSLKH
jgi:hypothetical protein